MSEKMQNWITPLSHLGLICIKGVDAKTFLQGQVTCNLEEISLTQTRLGAHCNLKGRMQSLFRLLLIPTENGEPHYYLSLPLNMVPSCLQNLKKYAMFSKVQIEEATTQFQRFGIQGVKASEYDLEIDACLAVNSEGLILINRIAGSPPRFELYIHPDNTTLAEKLMSDFSLRTPDAWETADVEAGLPTVLPETIDTFLPHHVNLADLNGISFNKGCYLGQEIIARMQFRGKIKKHMYHYFVETNQAPAPGDPILTTADTNEAPGIVVRVVPKNNGYEFLAVLEEEQATLSSLHLKSSDLIVKL